MKNTKSVSSSSSEVAKLKTKHKSAEKSAGLLLWQVSTLWQRQQREALAACKLTHAQFVYLATLAWLSSSEDLITQARLIQMNKMDKMMMSDLTTTLVARKFIKKKKHPADKRASVIEITNEGLKIVNQAIPLVEAVDDSFFQLKSESVLKLIDLLQELENKNTV